MVKDVEAACVEVCSSVTLLLHAPACLARPWLAAPLCMGGYRARMGMVALAGCPSMPPSIGPFFTLPAP